MSIKDSEPTQVLQNSPGVGLQSVPAIKTNSVSLKEVEKEAGREHGPG